MEGLEVHEHIEHAGHGDGHVVGVNRRVALLIAVLAAALAIAEAAGKAAQTEALSAKEASDLWAFYQAKTIRQTTVRTAADAARLELAAPDLAPDRRAAVQRQVDAWEQTAARYESDPASLEGRKELTERAKEAEAVVTTRPPPTTTSSSARPASSSPSCWPRPPPSPAPWRSPTRPAAWA